MKRFILFTMTLMLSLSAGAEKMPNQLTVYTSRKTHLVQPLFDLYKKESGVEIQAVNGKDGALIERLKREGKNTPADLLITVDAGNLWYAASQGLFQPVPSKALTETVPQAFRDSKNRWFGLSLRARTIFYNTDKVKKSELVSYEKLAEPSFKGRLCLRTSKKVYNQSLVASLIDRLGAKKAEQVVKGWVANLAKPVFTSDSLLLEAIQRGGCHVGIANTYYMARLEKKGEAKKVKAFWPNQKDSGVHVNISGAGVVANSDSPKAAIKFLEWLASDKAQDLLARANDEYPVKAGVPVSRVLKGWGSFKRDQRPMETYGRLQKQSILLMDKAKYR